MYFGGSTSFWYRCWVTYPSVRAAESQVTSAPRWCRSALQVLTVYLSIVGVGGWGVTTGSVGGLFPEEGSIWACPRYEMRLGLDEAGCMGLTWTPPQTAVWILVFFTRVSSLSLVSLVTHIKGSEMPTWHNWKAWRYETLKEDNEQTHVELTGGAG